MVSFRCKMVVQEELDKLGLHCQKIELNQVEVVEDMSFRQWHELYTSLKRSGIELMNESNGILIERIKLSITDWVQHSEEPSEIPFSSYISAELHCKYADLASLFLRSQGVTIEQFLVYNKVERIKVLLMCNDLNISEIAWKLGYCNIAHLSSQFKKITGLTPTVFKKIHTVNNSKESAGYNLHNLA